MWKPSFLPRLVLRNFFFFSSPELNNDKKQCCLLAGQAENQAKSIINQPISHLLFKIFHPAVWTSYQMYDHSIFPQLNIMNVSILNVLQGGKCTTDTLLGMTKQDTQLNPSLMFTERSIHGVKTLELTTAALLSHSSKVCYQIRLFLPDNK